MLCLVCIVKALFALTNTDLKHKTVAISDYMWNLGSEAQDSVAITYVTAGRVPLIPDSKQHKQGSLTNSTI